MSKIKSLLAREILDSKGDPTVEVELTLDNNHTGIDSAPSGASTGEAEAYELRDNDPNRYSGKGVLKAVNNVNTIIQDNVKDKIFDSQKDFDEYLISLDKNSNKSFLGANAILPVSLAFARAQASSQNQKLYEYLNPHKTYSLPRPMILLIEGGKHGDWATDIQEFMILPQEKAFPSFSDTIQAGVKIFSKLGDILESKHYSTGVGFEGAYCPKEITSNDQALEFITQAIQQAGFNTPDQFVIAIDLAASEFYSEGNYVLKSEAGQIYNSQAWLEKIIYWANKYPLFSLEDPFDQNQWEDWSKITTQMGNNHQLVGDDLVVTNKNLIQKAIDNKACNSVIIKPNQIGTLSETLDAIRIAQQSSITTILSHRGGETNDSFVADLAVAMNCPQCKFGGPNRGERLAKYNRLLNIENQIQNNQL